MANTNKKLISAKQNKDDEFYTLYEDVEKTILSNAVSLKGKSVYCPCDDPRWSNFWIFLHRNFSRLGLRKLVCSFFTETEPAFVTVYEGSADEDISAGKTIPLIGDGAFQNIEMEPFFADCDIVITNPPFSLFRLFIDRVLMHGKDFLVIGPSNGCIYRDIFEGLKTGTISTIGKYADGMLFMHNNEKTRVPAFWFTTLHVDKECTLNPTRQTIDGLEKYDNYDALHIDALSDYPDNYYEPVGCPITIISKIDQVHYRLVDILKQPKLGDKHIYVRFIVQRIKQGG